MQPGGSGTDGDRMWQETAAATCASNCSVTVPRLSREVRNTATTASVSASVMSGADNGIFMSRENA